MIISCKEAGEIIKDEWVKSAKLGWTYKGAQCLQPITNREGCLVEIVKYGTKIFTEPDVKNKSRQQDKRTVYALALYKIIEAMQGIRIFERFGFNVNKAGQSNRTDPLTLTEFDEFLYDLGRTDWIDIKSNLPLTEYTPAGCISYFLDNCIDTELC